MVGLKRSPVILNDIARKISSGVFHRLVALHVFPPVIKPAWKLVLVGVILRVNGMRYKHTR